MKGREKKGGGKANEKKIKEGFEIMKKKSNKRKEGKGESEKQTGGDEWREGEREGEDGKG